jgi:uncharacterized protein (TIGR03089 family)
MALVLPGQVLDPIVGADPGTPILTYYDLETGERTELSAATLGNWVAKTANLLVEELDLEPAETVGVLIPPHWQTAAILLATWAVGGCVRETADGCAVVFCTEPRIDEIDRTDTRDIVVTSLEPFGRPLTRRQFIDFPIAVRAYADSLTVPHVVPPDAPALRAGGVTLSHAGLGAAAEEMAARLRLTPRDRMLVEVDSAAESGPVAWLLAPLSQRTRLVLVKGTATAADASDRLDRLVREEGITCTVGVPVPERRILGM